MLLRAWVRSALRSLEMMWSTRKSVLSCVRYSFLCRQENNSRSSLVSVCLNCPGLRGFVTPKTSGLIQNPGFQFESRPEPVPNPYRKLWASSEIPDFQQPPYFVLIFFLMISVDAPSCKSLWPSPTSKSTANTSGKCDTRPLQSTRQGLETFQRGTQFKHI